MILDKKHRLLTVVACCVLVPSISWARSELDARVSRIENILANELSNKILQQMDGMQQEIRELRGKLEEQQNAMQHLGQKQEKLFLNLDARINQLDPNAVKDVAVENSPAEAQAQTFPAQQQEMLGTNEKALFEAANSLMQQQKFAEAILDFRDLLWQFPEGSYACEAYYWLGELYRMQWHANKDDNGLLNHAKDSFNIVINKYPQQEREGDALLKLALLEMEQDHLAAAKDLLLQVVNKYPDSARARVAENNIARIDQAKIGQ